MKKYFTVAVVGLFVLTSVSTSALAANHANNISLSATYTLLTHTFTETILNKDAIVPVMANSSRASHDPLTLRYSLAGIDSADILSTQAAVLSTLPITLGGYTAQAGSKNTYILVVLAEHRVGARPTSLSLSSLPFLITTNGVADGQSVKTY